MKLNFDIKKHWANCYTSIV